MKFTNPISAERTGTQTVTVAHGTTLQTVFEVTKTNNYQLSAYFDLNALVAAVEGGTVTIVYELRIDNTNYREIGRSSFIVGTTTTHPGVEINQLHENFRVRMSMGTAVTADRAVPWKYQVRDLD